MLFNSIEFLLFFPLVTALYFGAPVRLRWGLLLGASYYFYMAWEPLYAILMLFCTVVGYFSALAMDRYPTKEARRPIMWTATVLNLGVLFVFKYYNWANANLTAAAGGPVLPVSELILPMGISFYTLQVMGYVFDVYRQRLKAERHFGIFALYVCFFPQLVAGPIERAASLLPQFKRAHGFDHHRVAAGLGLMAWGMFKKAVVADRLAAFTEVVYANPGNYGGVTLTVATILFGFQLYCDFSGYSDIAVGGAQVLGFDLMQNFKRPYFSRNIEELWGRRWHISLVSWMKDYVYNPLAFATRRASALRRHSNILIVFLITGLWHGAAWKFVLWGVINGCFVLGHVLSAPLRKRMVAVTGIDRHPRLHAGLSIVFTFCLFAFGSIFFLARDLSEALRIIASLPTGWGGAGLAAFSQDVREITGPVRFLLGLLGVLALFVVEIIQERGGVWMRLSARPAFVRWGLAYGLLVWIILLGVFEKDEFIYFQF